MEAAGGSRQGAGLFHCRQHDGRLSRDLNQHGGFFSGSPRQRMVRGVFVLLELELANVKATLPDDAQIVLHELVCLLLVTLAAIVRVAAVALVRGENLLLILLKVALLARGLHWVFLVEPYQAFLAFLHADAKLRTAEQIRLLELDTLRLRTDRQACIYRLEYLGGASRLLSFLVVQTAGQVQVVDLVRSVQTVE